MSMRQLTHRSKAYKQSVNNGNGGRIEESEYGLRYHCDACLGNTLVYMYVPAPLSKHLKIAVASSRTIR